MTLIYARIADRVVADEYASVCTQFDALYNNTAATPGALPAEIETAAMTRLRQQAHARMLGNGLCTRPIELERHMESACETCAYFKTGPEFVPVLLRQRDHARDQHQPDRAALFDSLIPTNGNFLLTTITRVTPALGAVTLVIAAVLAARCGVFCAAADRPARRWPFSDQLALTTTSGQSSRTCSDRRR